MCVMTFHLVSSPAVRLAACPRLLPPAPLGGLAPEEAGDGAFVTAYRLFVRSQLLRAMGKLAFCVFCLAVAPAKPCIVVCTTVKRRKLGDTFVTTTCFSVACKECWYSFARLNPNPELRLCPRCILGRLPQKKAFRVSAILRCELATIRPSNFSCCQFARQCGFVGTGDDLIQHYPLCHYNIRKCPFTDYGCEAELQIQPLRAHASVCPYKQFRCNNTPCAFEGRLRYIMLHQLLACPFQVMCCWNDSQGCLETALRQNEEQFRQQHDCAFNLCENGCLQLGTLAELANHPCILKTPRLLPRPPTRDHHYPPPVPDENGYEPTSPESSGLSMTASEWESRCRPCVSPAVRFFSPGPVYSPTSLASSPASSS